MARDDRSSTRRTSLRDKARQRAEENKYTGGSSYIRLPEGMSFFKPKSGTNVLNFLPYEVSIAGVVHDGKTKEVTHVVGDLEYTRTILVHRYIGPEDKTFICPRTVKKPCPVCEERARLSKLPAPNSVEETKALENDIGNLKPQVKDIFNVINDDDRDAGVQLFEFSHANFREVLEEELREGKDEWSGFADLEEGFTVRARFSEETFDTNKFLKATRIDFDSRKPYDESILQKVADLDACLIVETYDKLKAILWGADEPETAQPQEQQQERAQESRRSDPEPEKVEERSGRTSRQEPEKAQEPERSGRTSRQEPEPEKSSGTCPSGHKFGADCDDKSECNKCPTTSWDPCRDEKDKLMKK